MIESLFFDDELLARAASLFALYRESGLRLVVAESCTGGLVSALLTEFPGSSVVVERGFVTYSNEAKSEALGVPDDVIAREGAVSEPVARAMAEGALRASRADVAAAVTGIAGPDGGSAEKPVGLVHFATSRRSGETKAEMRRFGALGRSGIRRASIVVCLDLL